MDQSFNQSKKPGFIMRMFWRACGADQRILEKCDYREHVKYACLGGIVTTTGLMAGLAGGYAFYTIFQPKGPALESGTDISTLVLSLLFGAIWGTVIFNIDRFIVASTGQGDGTEAITKNELIGALPRIVMGIIIAITISKPLEIRIFKSEIDVALEQDQLKKQSEFITSLDTLYNPRIKAEKAKMAKWEEEITRKERRYAELEDEYNREITRDDRRGVGPIAEALLAQMKRMEPDIKKIKQENKPLINTSYAQIERFEAERQKQIKASQRISNGLDGLLERIKLSHEIAGWGITLFITLLFVAIELTPIFFKLMLIKSPYDFLSDNEKELIKASEGIEVRYNYYQDKTGIEKDLVIFHESDRIIDEQKKLSEAQRELNDYIVKKWLEVQKQKVDENPEKFVSLSNDNRI
ncbi:MAG: DUF4407 domain-containing protein [Haliscomenobacter sp.]|nr:DUF4407 domain-containing protein [Haliscomenobacter sp.]MBK9488857.1 DUF4407 domain-containing protein [Haliscomenobacter sp.]